jgi:hypothetical protein
MYSHPQSQSHSAGGSGYSPSSDGQFVGFPTQGGGGAGGGGGVPYGVMGYTPYPLMYSTHAHAQGSHSGAMGGSMGGSVGGGGGGRDTGEWNGKEGGVAVNMA